MDIVKNALAKRGMFDNPRKVGGPDGLAARLVPFTSSSGNLWARRYDGTSRVEMLGRHAGSRDDFSVKVGDEAYGPVYVVYSYNTPIAWVDWLGEVHQSPYKYSVTTTQHMGQLTWLGQKNVPINRDGDLMSIAQFARALIARGEWV